MMMPSKFNIPDLLVEIDVVLQELENRVRGKDEKTDYLIQNVLCYLPRVAVQFQTP